MQIKEITSYLESLIPLYYQESYDNCGLIVGDKNEICISILTTLDCTEEVVEEAIKKNCNLIIAHHPIVFNGLKKINGSTSTEKIIIKAIKNNIAIYALHTNLDNMSFGVNKALAQLLNLENLQILSPITSKVVLKKLEVFIPNTHTALVTESLFKQGLGTIDNYSHCGFISQGQGTFVPNIASKPFLGQVGQKELVQEDKFEGVFEPFLENNIVNALLKSHPYETPAYNIFNLENSNPKIGAGMSGFLENEMPIEDFFTFLKQKLNLKVFKYTKSDTLTIKKIALCGGSGSFLLNKAMAVNADVYITSDYKYHDFFEANNKIVIIDIGHYESEIHTKDLIKDIITKKFSNFAVHISEIDTNPIKYFL